MFSSQVLDCTISAPSSTYDMRVVSLCVTLVSKALITDTKYSADKIGDRAEPWPTPTSACILCDFSPFQAYEVNLSTKYDLKKATTSLGKPSLSRASKRTP